MRSTPIMGSCIVDVARNGVRVSWTPYVERWSSRVRADALDLGYYVDLLPAQAFALADALRSSARSVVARELVTAVDVGSAVVSVGDEHVRVQLNDPPPPLPQLCLCLTPGPARDLAGRLSYAAGEALRALFVAASPAGAEQRS
jgi:hypothetical protein